MRINKCLIAIIFFVIVENQSYVIAQTHCQFEGTIWEYFWDKSLHRDFVAFVSENKAISYSYELDEFEFLYYRVRTDTIIMTTCIVMNNAFTESPVDSITYIFKNESNHLLLLSVFYYENWQIRRLFPDKIYTLYKKEE